MVASIEDILGLRFKTGAKQSSHGRKPSKSKIEVDFDTDTRQFPLSANFDFVGTEVYVQVDGNDDDPSSDWLKVQRDRDGDYMIALPLSDDTILRKTYLQIGEQYSLIDETQVSLDEDKDLVISLKPFDLKGKIGVHNPKSIFERVEPPQDMTKEWQHDKFQFKVGVGMRIVHKEVLVKIPFPFDADLETGWYILR